MKIVEAEKKKAAASTEETPTDGIDEVAAAQLLKLKAVKISQKIVRAPVDPWIWLRL